MAQQIRLTQQTLTNLECLESLVNSKVKSHDTNRLIALRTNVARREITSLRDWADINPATRVNPLINARADFIEDKLEDILHSNLLPVCPICNKPSQSYVCCTVCGNMLPDESKLAYTSERGQSLPEYIVLLGIIALVIYFLMSWCTGTMDISQWGRMIQVSANPLAQLFMVFVKLLGLANGLTQ